RVWWGVEVSDGAATRLAPEVARIALAEGLPGHARAVEIRAEGPRPTCRRQFPAPGGARGGRGGGGGPAGPPALPRGAPRAREPSQAPQLEVAARLNTNECP